MRDDEIQKLEEERVEDEDILIGFEKHMHRVYQIPDRLYGAQLTPDGDAI